MPRYRWEGIDIHGKSCAGELYASSVNDLQHALLKEQIALLNSNQTKKSFIKLFERKLIQQKELISLFDHLAILIESGIDVTKAISLCQTQKSSTACKKLLSGINSDIQSGKSLSTALTMQAQHFSPFIIHLIAMGEHSGQLATTLRRLAQHLHARQELTAQLKKAALLPSITLIFALLIVSALFIFVIPQFAELFDSMGKPIPEITQKLISISTFLRTPQSVWFWVGLPLGGLGIKKALKWNSIKAYKDTLITRLNPALLLPDLISLLETLELCLSTGIPLHESLNNAQQSVSNILFRKKIADVARAVSHGSSFNQAATRNGFHFFPQSLINMLAIGEQTGTLSIMISKAKTLLQAELNSKLIYLTTMVQPILLIIVGIIIAGLMTALYLPIFNLANAL